MALTFFSFAMNDRDDNVKKIIREFVNSAPIAAITDRDAFFESTLKEYQLPEMPQFPGGDITQGTPVIDEASGRVSKTFYFPVSGEVEMFRLHTGNQPVPLPTFEQEPDGVSKTYSIEKSRVNHLDEMVDTEVKLINQYRDVSQRMIPHYNVGLRAYIGLEIDRRVKEIQENQSVLDAAAKSKFPVREPKKP